MSDGPAVSGAFTGDEKEAPPRPAVSLSMAGHCRTSLFFDSIATELAPIEQRSRRTMDVGHLAEAAMFDSVTMINPLTKDTFKVGPWWPEAGVLKDYKTGEEVDAGLTDVSCRQEEVEVDGWIGHLDGVLRLPTGEFVVGDCKAINGRSWIYNIEKPLTDNVFTREYVMQLQAYIEGKRRQKGGIGKSIERGVLIFYNKENGEIALRFVKRSEKLLDELLERLSWARSDVPPKEHEYTWIKGGELPLRCGYCGHREACAVIRGEKLEPPVKGSKRWRIAK